jgi:hypothetical protein
VIGRIEREPPELHLEMAIDGYRFALDMDGLFEGYTKRSKTAPKKWVERVKVKLERARRFSWYDSYNDVAPPRKRRE